MTKSISEFLNIASTIIRKYAIKPIKTPENDIVNKAKNKYKSCFLILQIQAIRKTEKKSNNRIKYYVDPRRFWRFY